MFMTLYDSRLYFAHVSGLLSGHPYRDFSRSACCHHHESGSGSFNTLSGLLPGAPGTTWVNQAEFGKQRAAKTLRDYGPQVHSCSLVSAPFTLGEAGCKPGQIIGQRKKDAREYRTSASHRVGRDPAGARAHRRNDRAHTLAPPGIGTAIPGHPAQT